MHEKLRGLYAVKYNDLKEYICLEITMPRMKIKDKCLLIQEESSPLNRSCL